MYETTRQRVCKWLLLAVLVFSTLDAALFKSFRFERSRLTASLMLRNLTGEADTVYGGYESLRVRRIRPGDDTLYAPHASRYTYAWPRSFYLTISYRF